MKQKIKLVHFIHGLSMGGAETSVKEYALGLDKNKFDLTVLCLSRLNSLYEKMLEEQGIKIIYISDFLPFYKRKNIVFRAVNTLQRYYFVRKILRRLQPDIVHIHLVLNKMVKFAKLPKTTQIFYTQHFDVQRYKQDFAYDIKSLRYLIKNYKTRIIALNDSMRGELNELFSVSNTTVLNNGINLNRFRNTEDKAQIRKELGIAQDAFVIGHIGRFNAIKNHTFLIDIAAALYKENPNTFLLMVGSGPERKNIEIKLQKTQMKERTLILSDRTDIPKLLNAMDLFVFPSISEGIPLTLIEAQAAALPCIVSNAVPKAAKISNLITFKSLEGPVSSWVKAILAKQPRPVYTNLQDWDISEVIKKLERLYEQ